MTLNFYEQRALEIFKSLTQISISGFRTLALLNGGGSVAIVTYLGHSNLATDLSRVYVVVGIFSYIMGLVFCGVAYFTAHGTQLALFNQAIQQLNNPQQPFPEAHRRWLTLARWSCLLSLAFFVGGSVFAVFGLIGVHR